MAGAEGAWVSRAADDSDAEAGRPADETGPIPFEETGPGTDIAVPAVRPGPALLDADSWAEQPAVAIGVPYEGRRRAGPSPARMWLVIALVLAGLGVVVAVPIALFGGGNDAASAAATTGPAGDEVTGDQPLTPGGATLVPPMSVAARTTDPPRSPTPVTSRATTSRGATGAPPFPPVTLEAEADSVSLSGSAWVDNYAGALRRPDRPQRRQLGWTAREDHLQRCRHPDRRGVRDHRLLRPPGRRADPVGGDRVLGCRPDHPELHRQFELLRESGAAGAFPFPGYAHHYDQ